MAVQIIIGDVRERLKDLADGSVHCVVTSPPYLGLRDYGVAGQIGLEATPAAFVAQMVAVFQEVRRVLRTDGTLWLNLGDSYAGSGARSPNIQENGDLSYRAGGQNTRGLGFKPKDMMGIPWRVAFALQDDGWYLRQDIIWHKPNPMPESTFDRCTKAHEYLFLLSKVPRYYFDNEAIKEPVSGNTHARKAGPNSLQNRDQTPISKKVPAVTPKSAAPGSGIKANESFHAATGDIVGTTRNKRSVWTIATAPFTEAHFATFPPALVEPCVMAGTSACGCCPTCLTGWGRVVSRSRSNESGSGRAGNNPAGKGGPNAQHAGTIDDIRNGPVITTETIGWYPSCQCAGQPPLPMYPERPDRQDAIETNQWRAACARIDAERAVICKGLETVPTVPAVVLDPFGGAGTTGLVADRLQRNAILIELNPEYAAMARRRIDGDAPLFAMAAE
jgi:DNA modification methylase